MEMQQKLIWPHETGPNLDRHMLLFQLHEHPYIKGNNVKIFIDWTFCLVEGEFGLTWIFFYETLILHNTGYFLATFFWSSYFFFISPDILVFTRNVANSDPDVAIGTKVLRFLIPYLEWLFKVDYHYIDIKQCVGLLCVEYGFLWIVL